MKKVDGCTEINENRKHKCKQQQQKRCSQHSSTKNKIRLKSRPIQNNRNRKMINIKKKLIWNNINNGNNMYNISYSMCRSCYIGSCENMGQGILQCAG